MNNKICKHKSEGFAFKGFGMILGEYKTFYIIKWLFDGKLQMIHKQYIEVCDEYESRNYCKRQGNR